MSANIKFSLIIVAAGSGSRLKHDMPKQYIEINGKTILRHTLDIFLTMEGLQDICVVINPEHEEMLKNTLDYEIPAFAGNAGEEARNSKRQVENTTRNKTVDTTPSSSPLKTLEGSGNNIPNKGSTPTSFETLEGSDYVNICHGGNTRKASVYNGIKQLSNLLDEDIILIHDAARPFVKQSEIHDLLDTMQNHQAASLATPVVDTLRYSDKNTKISRDNLYAMQTPQAFHYGLLKRAHEEYSDKEYTDDTSLVSEMGIEVKFVESSKENFKITLKEDLILAQQILSTKLSTRTCVGQGYDVHAFDDIDAHSVRLCGVDIPHDKALKGHSDADVALHALTDAILGAIREGDIGLHFPPSNQDFKNMDSAVFVRHAMKLLRDKGGELINADITLICEAPKIATHRDKIIERLAEIMETPQARINIKATTTEKLGFTGRGEGIAAQAIVSVSI